MTRARAAAFAVAGLIAVGVAADDGAAPRAPGGEPLLLVYVGAEDCGPCRVWRRDQKPAFLAGLDPQRLRYREVIAPRLSQSFEEPVWPEDLRPYRASAEAVRGVPLWLVIRQDRVIGRFGGLSLWRDKVMPLLRSEARQG